MRISYEANRLASNHLSSAYEKLIPTIRHKIKCNKEKSDILIEEDIQTLKRKMQ